jgi:hypothetical protein
VLACGLFASACDIHVSSHGVSGNILGHSFAAGTSLPPGFPKVVPLPPSSRVLGGGMIGDASRSGYTAEFAVTGSSLASIFSAYEAQFTQAGFAVQVLQAPTTVTIPTTTTPGAHTSGTTASATAETGSFSATGPTWLVEVSTLSSSSIPGLKAGEVGLSVNVTEAQSVTSTT